MRSLSVLIKRNCSTAIGTMSVVKYESHITLNRINCICPCNCYKNIQTTLLNAEIKEKINKIIKYEEMTKCIC